MQKNDYFFYLLEQLQWLTADVWNIATFYNISHTAFYGDNEYRLKSCAEFIYRCFECGLIEPTFQIKEDLFVENQLYIPKNFVQKMIELPIYSQVKLDEKDDVLQDMVWMWSDVTATEKLVAVSDLCKLNRWVYGLEAVDMSDKRWVQFNSEILNIFSENGLPWEMEHPLFTIKQA